MKTLRRHFAHELAIGKTKLDGICVSGIAKAMQSGQAWALCFYAKTRMGWREKAPEGETQNDDGLKELALLSHSWTTKEHHAVFRCHKSMLRGFLSG